jgi:hypothetical protein
VTAGMVGSVNGTAVASSATVVAGIGITDGTALGSRESALADGVMACAGETACAGVGR